MWFKKHFKYYIEFILYSFLMKEEITEWTCVKKTPTYSSL